MKHIKKVSVAKASSILDGLLSGGSIIPSEGEGEGEGEDTGKK